MDDTIDTNSLQSQALVIIENEIPLADSRQVAEKLGIEHRSFFSLITEYQEEVELDFGKVRFQIAPSGKTNQSQRYALLTEDQSYVYLAYSKNTEQARACKRLLVKAFSEARQRLAPLSLEEALAGILTQHHKLDRFIYHLQGARTILHEPGQAKMSPETLVTFLQNLSTYELEQDTPAYTQGEIVRHLDRRGALSLNTLRNSYMKKWSTKQVENGMKALMAEETVTPLVTSHTTKYVLTASLQEGKHSWTH
jgi:phage regulator Rha-like protein